jgi:hypothetical protein
MRLTDQLTDYVNAAFTGIWIKTFEPDEAEREILQRARSEKWKVAAWDIADGLRFQIADRLHEIAAVRLDLVRLEGIAVLADAQGFDRQLAGQFLETADADKDVGLGDAVAYGPEWATGAAPV